MLAVLRHVIWRRQAGLLWWSLGTVAVAALLAVAYPTVSNNNELNKAFAGLPPSVQAALGLDPGSALTSPVGYLNSQYFANILPVMLLVFGIGLAAWATGGDESAGTLELLLANPVSRLRVAGERAGALLLLLGVLAAVSAATLLVLAPSTGLTRGLSAGHIVAADAAGGLLALTFATLTFAIGAWTGSRSLAISVSSALAVAGFVIEGIAAQVPALRPIREASPWHWMLGSNPLQNGFQWHWWLPPFGISLLLASLGIARFRVRDLH
ncbi:MAG: ABC transporter permease subunit [Candidatus Dormibacteraceae bacterium]